LVREGEGKYRKGKGRGESRGSEHGSPRGTLKSLRSVPLPPLKVRQGHPKLSLFPGIKNNVRKNAPKSSMANDTCKMTGSKSLAI
jgi:hypothetical protein